MCPFDCTVVVGSGIVWPVNRLTTPVDAVTSTDRPKWVRNRYVIKVYGGVFCIVILPVRSRSAITV